MLIKNETKSTEILSFELLKVEKGREKICQCNPPHYIIDTTNRIVTCEDCGATLDAFEALLVMCNYMAVFEEYQEKVLERIRTYNELADQEQRRRMKYKVFKDMDKQYQEGMLPHCPECGEVFDPVEITCWTNKRYHKTMKESERPERRGYEKVD